MKIPLIVMLLAACAAAQPSGPLMQAILPRFDTVRLNLVEAAELMPEDSYTYHLTPPQRSWAEWISHNIQMNYNQCGRIHTAPAPDAKEWEGVSAKAELVAGLKESFAYCEGAFKAMTDEKALQSAAPAGGRPVVPAGIMIGLLNSWNEHYGNMVGYLRTRNLVPPSTARAAKAAKK